MGRATGGRKRTKLLHSMIKARTYH